MPQPDNVTPFRPRRAPPRPAPGNPLKSHRGKAVVVHSLTLAAFAISLFAMIGSLAPKFSAYGVEISVGVPLLAIQILGYVSLALVIAAVLIAASNRHEGMPWAMTHHEYALRTLVIGWAVTTLVGLLTMLPRAGLAALIVVLFVEGLIYLWTLVRGSIGLAFSAWRKPIPNPKGLFM